MGVWEVLKTVLTHCKQAEGGGCERFAMSVKLLVCLGFDSQAHFQGLVMVIGGLLVNAEKWGSRGRGSVMVRGATAPLPPPPPLPLAVSREDL